MLICRRSACVYSLRGCRPSCSWAVRHTPFTTFIGVAAGVGGPFVGVKRERWGQYGGAHSGSLPPLPAVLICGHVQQGVRMWNLVPAGKNATG